MTNDLTLFDDFQRTNARDMRSAEGMFAFLNQSAWPLSGRARTVFEQWFSNYPDDRKASLRTRFRKDDHSYDSAAFELMLYELLRRLDLAPVVEPEPPGSRRRPDFKITDELGHIWYVEATVAENTGLPLGDPLQNEVFDAINEIPPLGGIALNADARGTLERAPSRTRIQKKVRDWLESIDPEQIGEDAPVKYPRLKIRCGNWRLKLTAFAGYPDNSHTLIQAGPMAFGSNIDDASYLKDKIVAKARRYRNLDHPLIVAVSIPGSPVDVGDQTAALFGARAGYPSIAGSHTAVTGTARIPNSVWLSIAKPRYRGLHGVTFFGGWFRSVSQSHARTYINPFADTKIPDELLQLGSARVQDGEVVFEEGPRLGEILGLPEDWPGPRGMA